MSSERGRVIRRRMTGRSRSCPYKRMSPQFQTQLILQQLPRDHQPLDFAGTFADGAQLHVAIELFRRIIFDEAVAAVDLHAFVRARTATSLV